MQPDDPLRAEDWPIAPTTVVAWKRANEQEASDLPLTGKSRNPIVWLASLLA